MMLDLKTALFVATTLAIGLGWFLDRRRLAKTIHQLEIKNSKQNLRRPQKELDRAMKGMRTKILELSSICHANGEPMVLSEISSEFSPCSQKSYGLDISMAQFSEDELFKFLYTNEVTHCLFSNIKLPDSFSGDIDKTAKRYPGISFEQTLH